MGSLLQGLMNVTPTTPTVTPGALSNPNVINYPGTDPYYGITLSDLSIPTLADDTSTSSVSDPNKIDGWAVDPRRALINTMHPEAPMYPGVVRYNERGVQTPTLESLKAEAKWYNENYPGWQAYNDSSYNFFNAANYKPTKSTSSTPTSTGSAGGKFRIAKPNMTWVNNMPSVMPAGGAAMAAKYGPMPFTPGANTPQPVQRGLTYNNPYNTNPYLPLANPFALIANTPTSGS